MAHAQEARRLLDLPDAVLERILVAASDGGEWDSLGNARAACSRLSAIADAAARQFKWSVRCLCGLGVLRLLPRLGGLERVQLDFGLECDSCASYWGAEALEFISTKAQEVAQGFCEHCQGITAFSIRDDDAVPLEHTARVFGLIGGGGAAALPCSLSHLTSLSLEWANSIADPLVPPARLTQLTALKLEGCAEGAMKDDWLPHNLEELRLGVDDETCMSTEELFGIGGAGWLAALHAGACPKLRVLHLRKLAVRDAQPAGRWQGLTLANTLPRLTALEELDVTAYESTYEQDDSDYEREVLYALPFPAAPLLAALPNLRHCAAEFVREECRWRHYLDSSDQRNLGVGSRVELHCCGTPMLFATPAELATLHAPWLESLSIGLVTSSGVEDKAWRCGSLVYTDNDDDEDAEQGGGAVGAAAVAPAGSAAAAAAPVLAGDGLTVLRSLKLFVGCAHAAGAGADDSEWDLSALPLGSLPALRRLLVLPIVPRCGRSKLPLDVVARAAPGLEWAVIDPKCAGPLDALFCDDGCACNLRWVGVLPPPRKHAAAASARIEAEVRAGLSARAAAAAAQRYDDDGGGDDDAPSAMVTLFQPESRPGKPHGAVSSGSCFGATVERRPFCYVDMFYAAKFLTTGLRPSPLGGRALFWSGKVVEYERECDEA